MIATIKDPIVIKKILDHVEGTKEVLPPPVNYPKRRDRL